MDETYYKKYEPIFGAWKIKRKIGEGNFGSVFEIEREDFGTTYRAALKAITIPKSGAELESVLDDGMDMTGAAVYFKQFVEKIVGEFVLMSKLKGNSNVVSYEDHKVIKHDDGIGWDILIRMELLTPLMTYVKSNSITKRDVIKLGIDMCRALELCQKYNIIHRDIKPENIFISDSGDFKLGDFGIAKEVEKTQSGLTKTGTQTYMAPEVYKGQPYGSSVDMYSLGIVLYRLLNHNRAPFMPDFPQPISYSDRERALIMRMGGHKLPVPSGVGDCRLAEIAIKACSFKPEDRYSSPTQMREDLEAILYTEGEQILMFPSGDNLEIKSVEYISNSKDPYATEVIGNDATDSMDSDMTEIMMEAEKKTGGHKKKNGIKKKKVIIAAAVCGICVAVSGAYILTRERGDIPKTEETMTEFTPSPTPDPTVVPTPEPIPTEQQTQEPAPGFVSETQTSAPEQQPIQQTPTQKVQQSAAKSNNSGKAKTNPAPAQNASISKSESASAEQKPAQQVPVQQAPEQSQKKQEQPQKPQEPAANKDTSKSQRSGMPEVYVDFD